MTTAVIVADRGSEMARLTESVRLLREMEIVRHASGRAPLARLIAAHRPAVVVIGEMSPRSRTLDRISEVRGAAREATVVVVAGDAGSRWLADALRAGATAVLPGGLGTNALAAVLQEVIGTGNPGDAGQLAIAA
jgi:DNA-binding NarL/FixJ family response regulator